MGYKMPFNVPMHVDHQCHEEVTRKGELQPCDLEAITYRIDEEEGSPYPVCRKHARGTFWMTARAELQWALIDDLAAALASAKADAWDEGAEAERQSEKWAEPRERNPYRNGLGGK